jgi:hypothetical protein
MGPVEFVQKIFPYDENLKSEMDKLTAEGWQTMQGMPPVVVFTLWREPQAQPFVAQQGKGGMTIDESKISIVKGG